VKYLGQIKKLVGMVWAVLVLLAIMLSSSFATPHNRMLNVRHVFHRRSSPRCNFATINLDLSV